MLISAAGFEPREGASDARLFDATEGSRCRLWASTLRKSHPHLLWCARLELRLNVRNMFANDQDDVGASYQTWRESPGIATRNNGITTPHQNARV